jgi:3-phenylpropionate/trans-cinnamate dioxygenase ferredoxin reductase subunit
VLPLRTLADAERIRERLHGAREIVVVGAGFIGLELAAVAAALGARVHILEIGRRAMARAVSTEMSRFFAEAHAARGATILFGATLARITGAGGRATGVETGDGLLLPADLVFVGIGVSPNVELAAAAGLPVENGIAVDEMLRTPDERISAIGDCASYPSPFAGGRRVRLESVQNAVDQGRCVAARITGRPAPYRSVPWFWSEQGDLRLQMAGLTAGHDIAVLRGDMAAGRFSVFCFAGARLLGVESVNSPADHMVARRLLAAGAELTPQQAADAGFDLKAHAVAAAKRDRPPAGPALA